MITEEQILKKAKLYVKYNICCKEDLINNCQEEVERGYANAFKEGVDWAKRNTQILWTNVNERLPDANLDCVVRTINGRIIIAYYLECDGTWRNAESGDIIQNVTHWFLIPNKLKEQI